MKATQALVERQGVSKLKLYAMTEVHLLAHLWKQMINQLVRSSTRSMNV